MRLPAKRGVAFTLSGDLFISEHIRRLSLCLGNMSDDFKPQNANRLKQVAEKLENYGDMAAANKGTLQSPSKMYFFTNGASATPG